MEMIALLLLPLAVAGITLFDGNDDDGGEEQRPDDVDLGAGDGDYTGTPLGDSVTAGGGYEGVVDGAGGDDDIAVEGTATPEAEPFLWDDNSVGWQSGGRVGDATDGLAGVIALRGGEGDDSITASGHGIDIDGGGGADSIDAAGLLGGHVHVGAGDSLVLPDAVDNTFYWTVGESGALDLAGMTGDQFVSQVATGGSVTGGSGDDSLTTEGGGVTLAGGEGDDVVQGNFDPESNAPTHSFPYDAHIGFGDDSLDGGAGDDRLTGDLGDTLTGGEGSDSFGLWLQQGSVGHVTDFDPAEDELVLHVDGHAVTAGQIGLVERGGAMVITLDGEDLAVLEGQTGLGVAIGGFDSAGEPLPWQDPDGNLLPVGTEGELLKPGDYPVIIDRYFPAS